MRESNLSKTERASTGKSQWLLEAADECQRTMADQNLVPDARKLPLNRYRTLLEYAGGFLLALMVSIASLLAIFATWNMLLHMGAE